MLDIVKEVEQYVHEHWLTEPQDMERFANRNIEQKRNFATTVLAYGDVEGSCFTLYTILSMMKQKSGDITTLKQMAIDNMEGNSEAWVTNYYFEDGPKLLKKSAEALKKSSDEQDIYDIIQAVQHYYVRMTYWLDDYIPWSKLSEVHHKIKAK